MKLLHLADLHLGKSVNEISMIPDQKAILLTQIPELIDREKIDAVLIAGDVYDRSIPPEDADTLLDDFLSLLSGMKIPVLAISGNHDSDERLDFGSRLFEKTGIYVAGRYQGRLREVTLNDEYGEVHCWLLPYVQSSQVRYFYPDDPISSYEDAVRAAIRHADIDFSKRNVILSHQFVTGRPDTVPAGGAGAASAFDPLLSGSEVKALNVGTVDRISSDVYVGFDYVALGHIHRPQEIGRPTVRYAGSPLKYSLSEADQIKSFTIIDLKEKGADPEIRLVPVKLPHEMRRLKGPFMELMKPENILYPDDYIFVTLTDRTPVPDAFSIVREHYPNAMGLRYETPEEENREEGDGEPVENKSFDERADDFSRTVRGIGLTDEELQILREVAEEAGVTGL